MRNTLRREQIAEGVVKESGDDGAFSLMVRQDYKIFSHSINHNPDNKNPLTISYHHGESYNHDWLTYKVTMPASEDIREVYLGIKKSIKKMEAKLKTDVFTEKLTRLDDKEYIFPLGFSGEHSLLPKAKHLELLIENGVIHFSHLRDSKELTITSCLDLSDLMIDHLKNVAPSKHYIKNPAVMEQIKTTYMYNYKLETLESLNRIKIEIK